VTVRLNGSTLGTFQPTERILAYGYAGADDIQVAGGVTLVTELYGGTGDDRLKGGNGRNVLIGGAGDDLLVGGNGRDVLVGDAGADRIVGNAQDDVLIAGATAFDENEVALLAILAEWTSGRSYAVRVANLMGTGTGSDFTNRQNGSYFLKTDGTDATVFDDDRADVLTGSSGQDWFFANLQGSGVRDRVTDLSAAEFALDLAFIQGP
jgi:Ca2+-binding RTX toxin-like protein